MQDSTPRLPVPHKAGVGRRPGAAHSVGLQTKKWRQGFRLAAALSLGFFEIESIVRNINFAKPELTIATAW
jgi:hypothetical protein